MYESSATVVLTQNDKSRYNTEAITGSDITLNQKSTFYLYKINKKVIEY